MGDFDCVCVFENDDDIMNVYILSSVACNVHVALTNHTFEATLSHVYNYCVYRRHGNMIFDTNAFTKLSTK